MTAVGDDIDWLVAAIVRPRPPAPRRLADTAVPAGDGLEVYRHAYRARLEECLADDFPTLRGCIGARRFAQFCAGVVRERPSRRPTLNRYGESMVAWLAARIRAGDGRLRPLRDLVRVEWAMVEAIHEPLADPIGPEAVAAVPPECWPAASLVALPSLRLLWTAHDPEPCLRAQRAGLTVPAPLPAPGLSLVHRRADGLVRERIPGAAGRLARGLLRGVPLGEALAAWPLPAAQVHDLLRRLVAAGVIHRIHHP
ncbi:MAG: hypothetical protein RLZZ127_1911 [Planctomycetota bacterium]|jgi:hypothetical protein